MSALTSCSCHPHQKKWATNKLMKWILAVWHRGTQVVLCCAHGLMDNGWRSELHLGAKDVDAAGSTIGWKFWLEEAHLRFSLTSLCCSNGCSRKVCLICVNTSAVRRKGSIYVQFLKHFPIWVIMFMGNKAEICVFPSFRKSNVPVKCARRSSKRQWGNYTLPSSPRPELQQQWVSPPCFSVLKVYRKTDNDFLLFCEQGILLVCQCTRGQNNLAGILEVWPGEPPSVPKWPPHCVHWWRPTYRWGRCASVDQKKEELRVNLA